MTTDSIKRQILANSKTIAVVGLSDQPHKSSHIVARYLKEKGYQIVPVNPNIDSVLGEKAYPDLASIPFPVDVVDVFRRNEDIPPIVDQALDIDCPVIWLQEGLECPEKEPAVQKKGAIMVQNSCIKVEHQCTFF